VRPYAYADTDAFGDTNADAWNANAYAFGDTDGYAESDTEAAPDPASSADAVRE
jgi:hypothetical protein